MNVVIDKGNTSTKVGIFNQRVLLEHSVFENDEEAKAFADHFAGGNIIISSVQGENGFRLQAMSFANVITLTHETPLPIQNLYDTKTTLGMDRLAAVCGACEIFPGKSCLVIDAGTCITYDFIDSKRNYHGGSISPGLQMRFRAMHTFTARLPLVTAVTDPPLTGKSTASCIQSGAIIGMEEEIRGIIRRYFEDFGDLKVILCGGDTAFFENRFKASIFASPELVLIGLNSILLHNVNP